MRAFSWNNPVLWAAMLALALAGLLECWRPFYFLTDDNFSHDLPILAELGRNLGHGSPSFRSAFLFGGSYPLLKDPITLWCAHPGILLVSLLANTPAMLAMVDVIAIFQIVLSAICFVVLLGHVRREINPGLGHGSMVFMGLSYAFTAYNLTVGSSWLFYLSNQVALPLYLACLLHRERGRGVALAVAGAVHAFLSSNPAPWIFGMMFGTGMALGLGGLRHSLEPIRRWCLACAITGLVIFPFLALSFLGFMGSTRAAGLRVLDANVMAVPYDIQICSWFLGAFSRWTPLEFHVSSLFALPDDHLRALGCFAASWLLFPVLWNVRRWRGVEVVFVMLLGLSVLLVARPQWLAEVFQGLPLLRSIRWPFKEMFIVLFFVHVLIAVGLPPLKRWRAVGLGAIGSMVFCGSLLPSGPPTFNPLGSDRSLVFSGAAQAFWKEVGVRIDPTEGYIPVASPDLVFKLKEDFPYVLLGGFNYGALFGVRSQSGYSPTQVKGTGRIPFAPYHWGGIYSDGDQERLRQALPHASILRVVSVSPLKVELEREGRVLVFRHPEMFFPVAR